MMHLHDSMWGAGGPLAAHEVHPKNIAPEFMLYKKYTKNIL
jgi:hypothetical protein